MSHLQAHSKASEASLAPQASHQPPKAASVRVICNETFLDIFKQYEAPFGHSFKHTQSAASAFFANLNDWFKKLAKNLRLTTT